MVRNAVKSGEYITNMADRYEQSLKAYEIMNFPLVTALEDDTLKTIAAKMHKNKVGSVIITNKNGKEVGIITQGDIIRYFASLASGDLYKTRAKAVMSKSLVYIYGNTKIEDAAKTMVQYKIKKLLVMDKDKNMMGIVTDNDIMKNASYLIDILVEMINTGHVNEIQ